MLCSFPAKRLFRGVSVLDFHSRIAGLAGFSVCTSLISGLTCDLGRQVSSELAFSVSWPVCGVCRLHKSDFASAQLRFQGQFRTCADTEPRLCRPESTSVLRQFLRGQLHRSTGGQLREAAVRTRLRRSTVRTPKWDPHQERPESVRITRITLSVTISETTTILIANFTGPST